MKIKIISDLKIMILLLLFIYAPASQAKSELIDEPRGCFATLRFPCAVRASFSPQKLDVKGVQASLNQGTSVILYSEKKWRLLEGQMWLRSSSDFQLSTGFVQFSLNGDSWIDFISDEKVFVQNLIGSFKVSSPLIKLNQAIPVGFGNWYSLIDSDGNLSQGILKVIEPRKFVPEWAEVARLPKKQAIVVIDSYRKSWKGNVEASAQLYQEVVNRRLASIERRQIIKARRAKAEFDERARLRRMFRERFENDQSIDQLVDGLTH